MKFNKISFQDKNAERVYDNYFKSLNNILRPILERDKQDVLMEFNSHIYEFLQSDATEPELNLLLNAIDKLGAPEEVLKPLIADKLLEKATKSFNPIHILKALLLNISNGFSYVIFFLLYLFLGSFIFLIFAKMFSNNVGMFFKEGKFQVLGLIEDKSNYQEVLGYWFIPVMLITTVILYFLITLLLKLKRLIIKK